MGKARNLSEVVDDAIMQNAWPSIRQAPDGQGIFVVLRNDRQAVGFHLIPDDNLLGDWLMIGFAVKTIDQAAMTSTAIRALPIGELLARARRVAGGEPAEQARKLPARFKFMRPSDTRMSAFVADRRGGRQRTDEEYAGFALEYALLVQEGVRSPVKTLTARYGGASGTWANRLAEARKRGLLTPTRSGEAGGVLTDKALRLLGHRDEDKSE